jgi:hypothetical protein
MTPLDHYRRAAAWAAEQMTTTEPAVAPPSTAGILALLALAVPCAGLVVSGDVRLLVGGLACSTLGFLAGVAVAAAAGEVGR